jgi:hypothetical protein
MRVWVVVLVVACAHDKPKPASLENRRQPTPARAPTAPAIERERAPCDEVADHVIQISRTSGDTKSLTEMIRRRCTDDAWSLDARTCYLTANSWDEGLACEPKLTAAQVKTLEDDIKAMGSTMGHPPPQP